MIKLKSIFGKGDTGGSIISSLNQTNLILVEIQKQMSLDFASRISDQKQQVISEKRRISRDKFALQEGIVETVRNIKSKVKQATEVVTRPVRNIFARILDFLKVLSAGIAVNGIFKWLSDPENRKKLMGWFNVIKDHWKWILGTLVTLIGLKLGSKLIGPLRILTTIGAFLGKRLLPLLGKVALVLGAAGIGKFIGNIAREVGEEIKGDGDSWWRNILSIPLLNFANLMDILWAPFQAIKEYIVAGGDIEESNKKMAELLEAVKDSYTVIPSIGKYYIFNYLAKTPLIQYDQNPLVGVMEVYGWGFKGFNYHWDGMRQYTWEEVQGNFYEIYSYELTDAKKIPFKKIVLNS